MNSRALLVLLCLFSLMIADYSVQGLGRCRRLGGCNSWCRGRCRKRGFRFGSCRFTFSCPLRRKFKCRCSRFGWCKLQSDKTVYNHGINCMKCKYRYSYLSINGLDRQHNGTKLTSFEQVSISKMKQYDMRCCTDRRFDYWCSRHSCNIIAECFSSSKWSVTRKNDHKRLKWLYSEFLYTISEY
jgi:hypothetical protein